MELRRGYPTIYITIPECNLPMHSSYTVDTNLQALSTHSICSASSRSCHFFFTQDTRWRPNPKWHQP
jgi:hypothetical protein